MSFSNDTWRTTSDPAVPKPGEIDIWRVATSFGQARTDSLSQLLSKDEIRRAQSYLLERDRNRFVIRRGTLRRIISSYLGVDPCQLRFFNDQFGKPFLVGERNRLRFNVSHSLDEAVIAITCDREIGVDIEFIDWDCDALGVALKVFPPNDVSYLRTVSHNALIPNFFAGWTRIEACLKATGQGFAGLLEQKTNISTIIEETDVSFRSRVGNGQRDWSLTSLRSLKGYKMALVVDGEIGTIRYWQLGQN